VALAPFRKRAGSGSNPSGRGARTPPSAIGQLTSRLAQVAFEDFPLGDARVRRPSRLLSSSSRLPTCFLHGVAGGQVPVPPRPVRDETAAGSSTRPRRPPPTPGRRGGVKGTWARTPDIQIPAGTCLPGRAGVNGGKLVKPPRRVRDAACTARCTRNDGAGAQTAAARSLIPAWKNRASCAAQRRAAPRFVPVRLCRRQRHPCGRAGLHGSASAAPVSAAFLGLLCCIRKWATGDSTAELLLSRSGYCVQPS